MIQLALRSDETVDPKIADAIRAILLGKLPELSDTDSFLLTMSAAARLLGVSRSWFWDRVTSERGSGKETFPAKELSPGVYRFRRREIEAFAADRDTYAPKRKVGSRTTRKQKIQRNKNASGN
jgi:predicted DNA-binding transcriptional regulator AlpA